jgi:hypothetical protein
MPTEPMVFLPVHLRTPDDGNVIIASELKLSCSTAIAMTKAAGVRGDMILAAFQRGPCLRTQNLEIKKKKPTGGGGRSKVWNIQAGTVRGERTHFRKIGKLFFDCRGGGVGEGGPKLRLL